MHWWEESNWEVGKRRRQMRWSIVNAEAPDRSAPSKQQSGWFNEATKKMKIQRRRRRKLFWLFAAAAVCALLFEEQVSCPLRAFDPGDMRPVDCGSDFEFGSQRCGDAGRRHSALTTWAQTPGSRAAQENSRITIDGLSERKGINDNKMFPRKS